MTIEEYILKNCGRHQYGEQDENGVDLSLIRAQLARDPIERVRYMDHQRVTLLELRKNARRISDKCSGENCRGAEGE